MFQEIILPIFMSTRLCVTVCGIMHPRCCRPPAGNIVAALEEVRCLKFNQVLIAAGWVFFAFHFPYQPSPSFASSQDNHQTWWHALCKGFMATEWCSLLFLTERNRHPHFTSVTTSKRLNCTYCRKWVLNNTERLVLSKLQSGLKLQWNICELHGYFSEVKLKGWFQRGRKNQCQNTSACLLVSGTA